MQLEATLYGSQVGFDLAISRQNLTKNNQYCRSVMLTHNCASASPQLHYPLEIMLRNSLLPATSGVFGVC